MGNVEQISDYWDKRERNYVKSDVRYWYQHPVVLKHYRDLVVETNDSLDVKPINAFLRAHYADKKFDRALSIGCGSAHKELQLLKDELVGQFDLYELSGSVIEAGKKTAEKFGVADRATFFKADIFGKENNDEKEKYDLVHWDNALHHMFSVKDAIALSKRMLKPGGVLVIDDYVGPSYMQIDAEDYKFADSVRLLLDKKYIKNNTEDKDRFPLSPKSPRIPVERFLATDPSEMVDAGNILPEIDRQCAGASVIKTGGILYFLGLRPLFGNFDAKNKDDLEVLSNLLKLDKWYTEQTGKTFHAFISWKK